MGHLQSVLILSSTHDVHALAVAHELKRVPGTRPVIVDTRHWPGAGHVTVRWEGADPAGEIQLVAPRDEGMIPLDDVVGVWWRRPTAFGVPQNVTDPVVQGMVVQQARQLFNGLLVSLPARHMNWPGSDLVAAWKPHQLRAAARAGLRTPRTLITDDPAAAEAFIDEVEDVVYKPLRSPVDRLIPTRRLTPDACRHLQAVRLAPVIFQERVPCDLDLRVTAVAGTIFSAGAPYEPWSDVEDTRVGPRHPLAPHNLPLDVARGIRRLMRELNLVYGALDLRRTPKGEYVFLEINPGGQYLWVEIEAGLPISAAIASWLATGIVAPTRIGARGSGRRPAADPSRDLTTSRRKSGSGWRRAPPGPRSSGRRA